MQHSLPEVLALVDRANVGLEWNSARALSLLKRDGLDADLPAVVEAARQSLVPMGRERLRQRLTLLGSAMAPGRSAQDAAAWLEHMAQGLRDIPEDLILSAIDEWVKSSRFPPTVADIRECTERHMTRRRVDLARLEAIERLIASGDGDHIQPAPPFFDDWRQAPDTWDESKRCTPEQARAILEDYPHLRGPIRDSLRNVADPGRPDRAEAPRAHIGADVIQQSETARKPTRADYIALGVDPAILDEIASERKAA